MNRVCARTINKATVINPIGCSSNVAGTFIDRMLTFIHILTYLGNNAILCAHSRFKIQCHIVFSGKSLYNSIIGNKDNLITLERSLASGIRPKRFQKHRQRVTNSFTHQFRHT